MGTHRDKMINGEPYLPADPELDAMHEILKGFVAEIGENTTFLQRLQIEYGYNTRVGAGSVVTRDLPAHVLAVGNPARVVRKI
ncbi:maltose acetyltransferase domain-containing protein [Lentzea albida]|uniref:Maltose acetyltransferase n=1 Tax=Lentzea albida TaxID=65499 RepID=A0A1H9LU03_9PSEU|nr:Maltose acetyltransferase [Lentzea albida]